MQRTLRLLDIVNQFAGGCESVTKVWDSRELVAEAKKLRDDCFKLHRHKACQVLIMVAAVVDLTILRCRGQHDKDGGLVCQFDNRTARTIVKEQTTPRRTY
jgi:hypothetical protein